MTCSAIDTKHSSVIHDVSFAQSSLGCEHGEGAAPHGLYCTTSKTSRSRKTGRNPKSSQVSPGPPCSVKSFTLPVPPRRVTSGRVTPEHVTFTHCTCQASVCQSEKLATDDVANVAKSGTALLIIFEGGTQQYIQWACCLL